MIMGLSVYNDFNFQFTQVGYYVYAEDKSSWNSLGIPKDQVGLSMTWIASVNEQGPTPSYELITYKDQLYFLGSTGVEYHIRMYAAELFVSAHTTAVMDIVYSFNNNFWYCRVATSTDPSISNPNYELIETSNLSLLEVTNAVKYKMDGYFTPVYSQAKGSFETKKIADHKFTINWIATGIASDVLLYDYNMKLINSYKPDSNTITFTMEKDGVYITEWNIEGVSHYSEIYDFTDSEKCFFDLVKNILCNCVDCEDCPGPLYERALSYINMYQTVFNIVYSDRAVNMGLVSTEILRAEFVSSLGLILAKMSIITGDCSCDKDN